MRNRRHRVETAEPTSDRNPDAVPDQGRALGDPTRYAIFDHLRQSNGPVSIAQLATVFPLHPNAIRLHLGKLRDASLVLEERSAPAGRGRPALTYRLNPGAIERWAAAGPHEELARMLLTMVETGRPAPEVGRDAGTRLAKSLSGHDHDATDLIVGVARRLGFEPTTPLTGSDPTEIRLTHCPFAVGAERAAPVVCELHRGLAEGVCQSAGGTMRVADLIIRPEPSAGCRLVLEPTN